MDAWKNAFFLQEKPIFSIKFLVLGGGGVFWVFLGGECRFYFYGTAEGSYCTPREPLRARKGATIARAEGFYRGQGGPAEKSHTRAFKWLTGPLSSWLSESTSSKH